MRELLLAAAAALTISAMPAFAASEDCPKGIFGLSVDAVTCDNDDNRNDATGTTSDSGDGAAQADQSRDAPNRLSDVVQSLQQHRGVDNQNKNN
jgi:hypothetical protein